MVKLNKTGNQVNTSKYKTYKNILTKVIRKAKALETENTIEEAGNDSRKLWGIMNEIVDRKQQKHKIPERFNINGKPVMKPLEIANAFNHYFVTIGKNMASKIPTKMGMKNMSGDHTAALN